MLRLIKRLFTREESRPEALSIAQELWILDPSDSSSRRFQPRSGRGYSASFLAQKEGRQGYELRLERGELFAWTECELYRYADFSLEARIAFGEENGHSSAGIVFRSSSGNDFYSVLLTKRGWFRIDAIVNGKQDPLVPWTVAPVKLEEGRFTMGIIARGSKFIVTLNGVWAGEAEDDRLTAGFVGLACQNYGERKKASCLLEGLSLDSRPVEVEAAYYRFILVDRPSREARMSLARSLFSAGSFIACRVQVKKAAADHELSFEDSLLDAECALRLGLYDEADRALDACSALDPERQEVIEEKANILYLQGKFGELREELEGRIDVATASAGACNLLGHARFETGAFAQAAMAYLRAVELEPDQAIFSINAARALERVKDRAAALVAWKGALKTLLRQEPSEELPEAEERVMALSGGRPDAEAERLVATSLFHRGESEAALEAFRRLGAASRADPAIRYLWGLLLWARGDKEEAIQRYREALAGEPDYPLFRFRLAEALFLSRGPADPELEAMLGPLSPGPTSDPWTMNLAGMRLTSLDRPAEALAFLEAARAALPGEGPVARNLALALGESGRPEEALSILDAFPTDAQAQNQAATLLCGLGRLDEAEKRYLEAADRAPSDPEILANLACLYLETERFSDAEAYARKALDAGDGNGRHDPRAFLVSGRLADIYGDRPRAEAAFRLGLEAFPADEVLVMALARLYLSWGKTDKARALARSIEGRLPATAASILEAVIDATTERLSCASCGRVWRVPLVLPSQRQASIRGMPPDESPAGACPLCGKVYCIACRKADLRESRFTCPEHGETLKLSDDRLIYLVRSSMT